MFHILKWSKTRWRR